MVTRSSLRERKWEAPPWQGTRHATGNGIEFLMASVYSHGRRQEVRDARASTRCSRIKTFAGSKNAVTFGNVDELKFNF